MKIIVKISITIWIIQLESIKIEWISIWSKYIIYSNIIGITLQIIECKI